VARCSEISKKASEVVAEQAGRLLCDSARRTIVTELTRSLALVLVVIAVGASGCSDSSKNVVSGEVTLDGKPLEKGTIRFVPTDGKLQPTDAEITQGKYTISVPAGESKVEIRAPKVVGKMKMYDTPDSPSVDKIEELLPAKYNSNTELKYPVTKGSQTKNFELQSK